MTPSQPVTTYEEKKSPRARNLQSIEGLEEKFDKGYDSDGQLGPFWGEITKEGPQLFDNDDDDGNCFVKEVFVEEQSNEEANTEKDADTNAETNAGMNTKKNNKTNNKSNSNDLDKVQDVPLNKEEFEKLTVND